MTRLDIAVAALERIAKGPDDFGPRWAMTEASDALAAIASASVEHPHRIREPFLSRIQATAAFLQLPGESAPGADESMGRSLEEELDEYQREAAPVETLADDAGVRAVVGNWLVSEADFNDEEADARTVLERIDAYRRERAGRK